MKNLLSQVLSAMRYVPVLALLIVSLSLAALPRVAAYSPSATIQNDSSFIDDAGYYHVVGEVNNTGDAWIQYVRISAVFKDQSGTVVDTDYTYTVLNHVPPGAASGFNLVELNTGKSALIRTYYLALSFDVAQFVTVALAVVNTSSSKNSLGWLEVVGEVQNNGDMASNYTKVAATFYGSDGKVVDVVYAYTDPYTVPAHDARGFKITVGSATRSSLVTTWSLTAQSDQYSSVAELPWPAVALLAALSLGFVAMNFAQPSKSKRHGSR